MPPRVPQRPVSFLGQEGGHALPPSHHVSLDPRELAPHQRPISISESNLPRDPTRHVSSMPRHVSHSRSQSSRLRMRAHGTDAPWTGFIVSVSATRKLQDCSVGDTLLQSSWAKNTHKSCESWELTCTTRSTGNYLDTNTDHHR